jgi:sugar lactone lactonase YvrE
MRLISAVVIVIVTCCTASGQTYTISTFAGGGLPINIPGTSASLFGPQSVAVDSSGNIFFTDPNYNAVLRLDAKTSVLTVTAGTGKPGFSGDDGPAVSAQLNQPQSVALDSAGNLYIADTGNLRVRRVSNGIITTVAGAGLLPSEYSPIDTGDNGPATSAQLYLPWIVALDAAGNLYIIDEVNTVRKV